MSDPAKVYADAVIALHHGQWAQAFKLASKLLSAAPEHDGAHFVVGVAALEQQQIPPALRHLHRATTLKPGRADYAAQLARVLAAAGLTAESVLAAEHAMQQQPDGATCNTVGVVFANANLHSRAVAAFRQSVAASPAKANLRVNLATSLMATGQLSEASKELALCLELDPRHGKAAMARSELGENGNSGAKQRLAHLADTLSRMAEDASSRPWFEIALSRELERTGADASALRHLAHGKSAARTGGDYTMKRDRALFDALIEGTGNLPSTVGCSSTEPIFLIGMPRTGTTLVDRILSSHPAVYAAGELQNFGVALKRASGSRTRALLDPDTITRAAECDMARVGQAYLESTRPATADKPHFTDKLPHNFLYAGFIAGAFPNAKILCLRRNPMDTCLSNFRQLFAQGNPLFDYSFDLLDTGRYYLLFDRLMAHWNKLFPGRILSVQYETLVNEQERVTREILDFCGLSFEQNCLRFEDNAAPVATASAVQVREPMFRSSLNRWKRYGPALDELAELLRDGGIAID